MDIFTLISISPELGSVLSTTLDVTAAGTESTQAMATSSCYRQGSFSFGSCDLSDITTDASARSTSLSWLWLNVLFAMMFLRRDIHRFWKVVTFLLGLPGTALIAGFMWLMGRRSYPEGNDRIS